MLRLQYPYVSILSEGKLSYGGNQQSADSAMIGKCGCGIIAATDTLLYLSRYHLREPVPAFRGLEERFPLSARQYYDCIAVMRRDYFPLIPHLGINGLMLMTGSLLLYLASIHFVLMRVQKSVHFIVRRNPLILVAAICP